MKGSERKQLRIDLGEAIGRNLSTADMAKLCGLSPGEGSATILKWEVRGPSGPAAELLRILAMASDRHPILESFNIFYRFDIEDKRAADANAGVSKNDAEGSSPPLGLIPNINRGKPGPVGKQM
jgi:hypothetical protein